MTREQTKTALKNVLAYIPEQHHEKLAPEFLNELLTMGGFTVTGSALKAGYTGSRFTSIMEMP